MKVLNQVEGLALRATIAAVLMKDQLVKISGDKTVAAAGSGEKAIGRLTVPARSSNGIGTVEVLAKERVEVKFSGNLAAGTYVRLAAVDGTTGESVVQVWTSGTHPVEALYGIVWKGANNALGEVLTF